MVSYLSVILKVFHVLRGAVWWFTRNLEYVSQLPRVVDGVEPKQRAGDERFSVLSHEALPCFVLWCHGLDTGLVHSFTTILHLKHCDNFVVGTQSL